jgi:hypothetical protein
LLSHDISVPDACKMTPGLSLTNNEKDLNESIIQVTANFGLLRATMYKNSEEIKWKKKVVTTS